ncbi:cyclin-dependent kinase inhibitor 3 family protein [Methylophaga thalassica]|uniref:cyclin-dependent kinase inhibitor 3 family protein n=1 Tax=Methylophaga thalassica TaxID=40223 RepID=UPI002E7B9E79|nr:cyclin-dependent kinase inhibitor 3 family protein [Methylophaga thalassica]WVI84612.1 cyclin-dependent kinase inhibitor 3 family protein [Methylophaga thalassica]
MNTHPITFLPLPSGGQFIFTPCPGTKETDIEQALDVLYDAGATSVITALPDHELVDLGVPDLGMLIQKKGMHWFQLPIEDDMSPDALFLTRLSQVKTELLKRLKNASTIAIHCRGGSGRTGLIAAILLLEMGMEWKEVKELVQSVRPRALTATTHLNFLETYYAIKD